MMLDRGGGGGTGAAIKNAIVSRGSGSTSVAYSVDSTTMMITATCATADSTVVVQRCRGTPDDGLTMVSNMRSLLSSEPVLSVYFVDAQGAGGVAMSHLRRLMACETFPARVTTVEWMNARLADEVSRKRLA